MFNTVLWLGVYATSLQWLFTAQNLQGEEQVTIEADNGRLRVQINGELFTEYLYKDYAKPIFFPLLGPEGIPMTRSYPMVKGLAGEAEDHPHHKSLWFTHGDVNGVNFWAEGEDCGRIEHQRILHLAGGSGVATLATENNWVAANGKTICADTREYWFSSLPAGRALDMRITIRASHGDVVFKDTKEGTFGIRTHPNLRLDREGEPFASMVGHAVNSAGDEDHALWGRRAAWVDYSGEIGGQTVGVAIFDHPTNPRHPTWWHARNYGLVAANPFGIHDFENNSDVTVGNLTIPNGKSVTFLYRVLLHHGDANRADVQGCFEQFAADTQPSISSDDRLPEDRRLERLKDFAGYFPMRPPESIAEWNRRADRLRRRIQIAAGLWPMPPRDPVQATIHGLVDRDDYTVEKVYFQSRPGLFATGNLYRPKDVKGRCPAVLCPHGHWEGGRFQESGLAEVRRQIVEGGERFEKGGRHLIQARCVQLARMGCVVFHYDMLGYADSRQIPFEVAHVLRDYRPEMAGREDWGLFSTRAELQLISVFGLQTYNSIRALDWLSSLPDVDPDRIGVTGASGGGTQTMILSAIDPRPAVSFPAVMVSTSMQGGCTCENACLLRVGAGNIDFAALFAPKPLGLTTADDMTRDLTSKGLPELRKLYRLFDATENVFVKDLVHFPHNYNYVSRSAMYAWMNRHLAIGREEPVIEHDYDPLTVEEMSVWDAQHPAPPGGPEYEQELMKQIVMESHDLIEALTPRNNETWERFRYVVGGAFEVLLDCNSPADLEPEHRIVKTKTYDNYKESFGYIENRHRGTSLPTITCSPRQPNGNVAVLLHDHGKAAFFEVDGMPKPEILSLLSSGVTVILPDLFLQGDFNRDVHAPLFTRKVPNPRDFAGFTFGYNDTLFAQRVSDILTIVTYSHDLDPKTQAVHVIGLHGTGPHVAAARAIAGGAIETAAIDTAGFRFADIASWRDPNFLPGAVKYGDLPALLALGAPNPIWLAGEGGTIPEIMQHAYRTTGHEPAVVVSGAAPASTASAAIDWLLVRIQHDQPSKSNE